MDGLLSEDKETSLEAISIVQEKKNDEGLNQCGGIRNRRNREVFRR